MNNKYIIPIVILVLILGGAYFYTRTSSTSMEKMENESMMEETAENMEKSPKMTNEEMMEPTMVEAPEGAVMYKLDSGTASYVAQKRFLQKEDLEVTGTTENVTGEGWLDESNNQVYLLANVGLDTLKTDSGDRDEDVKKMLNPSIATVEMGPLALSGLTMGEQFTQTIPLKLTINNVTQIVDFDVTGTVTEEGFTAQGTTNVKMSEFGVNPPSLLNVYTVDDEIGLKFDVTGSVVTQ